MNITRLSDQFATCDQIHPSDMEAIESLGFRSVICTRPDGEAEDQPAFSVIDECARARGLSVLYIPVRPSGATEDNHAAFARAVAQLPRPILGYCRSGQRATTLWQARHSTVV